MRMARYFRLQAQACGRLGSPMYESLLSRVAEDIERGGISCSVLAGHEDDPGPSALALRFAGGVHRLVLSGGAPDLARYYPSVGGEWDPEPAWRALGALLREQPDSVRQGLDSAPQTNEVGRSAALMGGLLDIGATFRHPVRLFELGSSAGLNLRADRFCYTDDQGRSTGDEASPLVLHDVWRGRRPLPWPGLRVLERLGSDVSPVDVSSEDGRLTLRSYVWPDQRARLERPDAAFAEADRVPAQVQRQDAVSFTKELSLRRGTTTVLWHSVLWQYLTQHDRDAVTATIQQLGAAASVDMPFAHLCMEPTRRTAESAHEFLVVLELWPTGDRRILGTSAAHGIPTVWE